MKLKEIKNRVKQIRDYENAEEDTLGEAKKTKDAAERQKLLVLIEGFRQSRANTVEKLIKLVRQLNDQSLWLTYAAAEQAEDNLRTPRTSVRAAEKYLKKGDGVFAKVREDNASSLR